ncbi:DUF4044 domain-containing protein [Oceanobacillus piezotolerans]|uniref:DUF4044 domain-containing protein n=1 Tax=Oceanobacillus piezotolerans TaxID=2448030 RepID=A0A498DF33_9BACI|nr:stressosome-associated protein Prli42 [Oceanobacillus piezotolerans]RLL48135.1 DUF4044 domain-containing protein [Oceanobacillus piezotolerans]
MASTTSNKNNHMTKRQSKRAKRQKLIVYIMILAMVLSTITAGLAYFIYL